MFNAKGNTKVSGADIAARARDAGNAAAKAGTAAAKAAAASKSAQAAAAAAQTAAQNAAQKGTSAAQSAAQGMNSAASSAAAGVGNSVKQGVNYARGWAAPMLENAADYTTATLAPKVSSALKGTAQQVRPVDTRKKSIRSIFTWSILGAAVAAALGAAGVVIKKRYQTAMDADTEVDATDPMANPAAAGNPGTGASGTNGTGAGVDGRVSTSGW